MGVWMWYVWWYGHGMDGCMDMIWTWYGHSMVGGMDMIWTQIVWWQGWWYGHGMAWIEWGKD